MHKIKINSPEETLFIIWWIIESSSNYGMSRCRHDHRHWAQLMTSYTRMIVADGGSGKVGPGAVPPDSGPRLPQTLAETVKQR